MCYMAKFTSRRSVYWFERYQHITVNATPWAASGWAARAVSPWSKYRCSSVIFSGVYRHIRTIFARGALVDAFYRYAKPQDFAPLLVDATMIQNDENCRIIAMFEIKYLPYLQRYLYIRLRTLSPVPEAAACRISMSSTPRKTKNYFLNFWNFRIWIFRKLLGFLEFCRYDSKAMIGTYTIAKKHTLPTISNFPEKRDLWLTLFLLEWVFIQ